MKTPLYERSLGVAPAAGRRDGPPGRRPHPKKAPPLAHIARLLWGLPGAYVDPTSGGILLQLLLGGSAGYLLLRALFRRILPRRLRRRPPSEKEEARERTQS